MDDAGNNATLTVTKTPGPPPKPGYKTTEFWLSVAAWVVAIIVDAGVFPSTSPILKIVATAGALLKSMGYTAARAFVKASVLLMVVGLAMSTSACTAARQQRAIATELRVLNGARDGLLAYDHQHLQDIVSRSSSRAQTDEDTLAYLVVYARVQDAMMIGYSATAAAALKPSDTSIAQLANIVTGVIAAINKMREDLGHQPPSTPTPASGPTSKRERWRPPAMAMLSWRARALGGAR